MLAAGAGRGLSTPVDGFFGRWPGRLCPAGRGLVEHADDDSGQIWLDYHEWQADWTRRLAQPRLRLYTIARVGGVRSRCSQGFGSRSSATRRHRASSAPAAIASCSVAS
jgi:hypothetical protein